jgi:hypothetical protein
MLSLQIRPYWQSAVLVLAIACPSAGIFFASGVAGEFENRLASGALFLAAGAMSLIVFFQEMYAFYVTNSRRLLWMSAAFFTLGIGMAGSSISTSGGLAADSYVGVSEMFRVTSEFAASIFILLGTLRSDRSIQESMEFKAYILVATIMVAAASTIVYIATLQESIHVPVYSSEYGWSLFSLYIELNVFSFFLVISGVYVASRRRNKSPILFWFIIGFLLLTFSEVAFTTEKALGIGAASSLVWAGKAFLVAAFAAFVLGLTKAR